jgi:hypothetical protein
MIFSPAKPVACKSAADRDSHAASRLVMRRGREGIGSIEVSVRHARGENTADAATYSFRHCDVKRDEAIQQIEDWIASLSLAMTGIRFGAA